MVCAFGFFFVISVEMLVPMDYDETVGLTRQHQFARARQVGVAVGRNYFEDFSERPEWRGTNFVWSNLPNLARRMARAACGTSFPHEVHVDVLEAAGYTAFETCKKLVIEAGFASASDIGEVSDD